MSPAMECLWLEVGQLSRRRVPRPEPAPTEARVRVLLAGVCATDLELARGYLPYRGIPGHEFVGVVEQAADPGFVGRRVVGEINLPCRVCPTCLAGRPGHCPQRQVLGIAGRDGAFAEELCLPLVNLHRLPDSLSDEVAVFCEPLAAACRIGEQLSLEAGQRVLVVGAGRLGQLVARVLALEPVELAVVARHPRQRALLEACAVDWRAEDQVPAGWADVVVEASGAPEGFELARRVLRPQGRLVLKSTYAGRPAVDLSGLVVDEIVLLGSRCGPFPRALELLAGGRVDPLPLVEARYRLADGLAALEHAGRPGALKVLIAPRATG